MFPTWWAALGVLSLVGFSEVDGLNIQGPWDIDFTSEPAEDMNTCKYYKHKIEQAYDQVGEIVTSTLSNLEQLRMDRPEAEGTITFARDLWDLSDRTLQAFFGISVNHAHARPGIWWEKVHEVFEPMDMTLQGKVNHARYESTIKPAIACGTKGWRYIAPDKPDPEDPEGKPLRETKDPKKASLFKDTGAWYWKHRYLWIPGQSNENELKLCTGARGITLVQEDLITICDTALGEQATLDWMKVTQGTHLDDLTGNIMSYNLLHEFAHFFGARGNPSLPGWPNGDNDRIVIDPQAVNFNRQPLYVPPGNPDGSTPHPGPEDNPNKILLAYGVPYIMWLANGHPRATQPMPELVINAADAYAIYASLTNGTGPRMDLQIGGGEVTKTSSDLSLSNLPS
ncbi:hypothetical protein F5Y10DRAFT_294057 [Nemania abortiva]|nr:hypothetical protein F5Y10DRAFT_294057 [Nemania abortiva]